ncbi:hypothetical protein [Salininema proteolyticum]|uniref:Uncharacterized protein n=1 Tax=Salininema proteolyticum TaxID=1607685 RepID=A0ABV8TTH6_9ACTN
MPFHEPGEPCTECDARGRHIVSVARPFVFEEAADLITNSERLRSFTDDHMGAIEMAAEKLRSVARPTFEEPR